MTRFLFSMVAEWGQAEAAAANMATPQAAKMAAPQAAKMAGPQAASIIGRLVHSNRLAATAHTCLLGLDGCTWPRRRNVC